MEAITLKCPQCGAMLTVPDTYIGRTSKCGRCRHDVFIKAPSVDPAAELRANVRSTRPFEALTNIALIVLLLLLIGVLVSYFV